MSIWKTIGRVMAPGLALLLGGIACAGELGPPIRDPQHFTASSVWSLKALREEHVVMQRRDYSCGAAALATLIRYYWGDKVTEDQALEAILKPMAADVLKDRVENGLTMTDLRKGAVALGYPALMGERSYRQMTELKAPVILRIKHLEQEHFVVFRGMVGDRVFLADPIRGNVRVSFERFMKEWTDGVVLVVAKPDVTELPKNAPLAVRDHSPVQPELQPVRRMLVLPR